MFKFITNLFKSVDFSARRTKIMGTFTKALTEAQKLDAEMVEEALIKQEKIVKIEKEIQSISTIQSQNKRFIEKLTNLVE